MNISDKKLEISIVVVSIVLIGGLGNLLKSPVQSALGMQDVSYEMPRPKASIFAALFELGERTISRQYINPFKDKKAEDKKKAEAIAKAKAAEEAKKTVAQKKKEAQKKTAKAKKPKVQVDIYGTEDKQTMADLEFANSNAANSNPGNTFNPNGNAAQTKNEKEVEDKDRLTADQWRALILAEPTQANIAKMVAAFRSEQLAADGFYAIVADLYKDNRPEVQELGLLAAKSAYNVAAFTVTAEYFAQLNPKVNAQAKTYLTSYGASSRLGVLAEVLKTNSPEAVELAADVVLESYRTAGSGGGNGIKQDPRASRGDVFANSPGNYSQFLPIFQDLAKSSDGQIASVANEALSEMQNLVAGL